MDPKTRNIILAAGVIGWMGVAAAVLAHFLMGDVVGPAGMGVVLVLWTGLRRHRISARRVEA